jgi:hypothetical protein
MIYYDLLKIACANGFSVELYLNGLDERTRGFHQEALFNIFYLFHSKKNNKYVPSGGNFSGKTALSKKFNMVNFMNQNVRTNGDISDFTMLDYDNKTIICHTSKCLTTYTGCDFDIAKIEKTKNTHYEYKGWGLQICLVLDNEKKLKKAMDNKHKTTLDISHHKQYD